MSESVARPGVRACMRCRWLFVSRDPELIRRCQDCKQAAEGDYSPRRYRVSGPGEVLRLADKGG